MDDGEKALSSVEVAEYVAGIANELTVMCEAARLDGLATILYAAHLQARRVLERGGEARTAN